MSPEETRAQTDDTGEFAAAHLAPGPYDVQVVKYRVDEKKEEGFVRHFKVNAIDGETVGVEFAISIGRLRGGFLGLREGEEGFVALIPGEIAGDSFTFEDLQKLIPEIAYRKELDVDGEYVIADIEPGVYTAFGVALPMAAANDEQRFAGMRLSMAVVEIEEDETTSLDITLGW